MKKIIALLTILLLVVFMVGCENSINPIAPQTQNDGISLEKKGGGKGGKEKVIYSVVLEDMDDTPLENNLHNYCPETETLTSSGYYNIIWERHSICVNVTPFKVGVESVTLYDDPQLYIREKKGKIVGVYFYAQDVDGPDGIQYSTKTVELESPVTPNVLGFTIPVQRDDIEVWRHKTHNGGARVEMVGTICIGDIIYTPVTP